MREVLRVAVVSDRTPRLCTYIVNEILHCTRARIKHILGGAGSVTLTAALQVPSRHFPFRQKQLVSFEPQEVDAEAATLELVELFSRLANPR